MCIWLFCILQLYCNARCKIIKFKILFEGAHFYCGPILFYPGIPKVFSLPMITALTHTLEAHRL